MEVVKFGILCSLTFTLCNGATLTPQSVSSSGCGGRIFTTHGELTPTQSLTPDTVHCVFTIITDQNVYLSVTHLDTPAAGSLKVTDTEGVTHDASDLLTYDLYGKWFQIEFQSALSDWFKLEWDIDVIGCDKTILSSSGQLGSPGYPFKYADNLTCTYRILSDNVTRLVIDDLNIEEGRDLLQVKSVDYQGENEYMFYTGDSKHLVQIGTDFQIRFTTDSANHGRGFHMNWEPVSASYEPDNIDTDPHGCDGVYMGATGYIESPNYPAHYYPDSSCYYTVYYEQVSYIQLHIDYFQLAPSDVLVVNTSEVSEPLYYYGNYSIKDTYPPRTFRGQTLNMELINNNNDTDRGFRISWSLVPTTVDPTRKVETSLAFCRETYTSMYGSIVSPNYPDNYVNFADCYYTINVTSPITLTLNDMDVEEDFDMVEVRRYNGTAFETLAELTHIHHMWENLHWTGSVFQIYFLSDAVDTKRGFNFVWRPAYDEGFTNTGRLSDELGVEVKCGGAGLVVNIPENTTARMFPGASASDLTFRDPGCVGDSFPPVVQLFSPLMDCDTTREEVDNYIVYRNIVQMKNSTTSGPLTTRHDSPVLRVECSVIRETPIIGFYWPKHGGQLLATGTGEFPLKLDIYRDANRTKMFTMYPQPLDLNEEVYVDISLDVDDPALTIAPKFCYAQPSLHPKFVDLSHMHVLIAQGCKYDDTVLIEDAPQKHVYFRFKTFEFLSDKRDVYIFCNVTICRTDEPATGRCAQGCNTPIKIQRREVVAPDEDDVYIVQGPLRIRRELEESVSDESDSPSGYITASIMAVSAVAMVIAAVVIAIVKRRT